MVFQVFPECEGDNGWRCLNCGRIIFRKDKNICFNAFDAFYRRQYALNNCSVDINQENYTEASGCGYVCKKDVEKINVIRNRKLITFTDLATAIGIAYNTLRRVMDLDSRPVFFKTLRKIKEFIAEYERAESKKD